MQFLARGENSLTTAGPRLREEQKLFEHEVTEVTEATEATEATEGTEGTEGTEVLTNHRTQGSFARRRRGAEVGMAMEMIGVQ
jgi:hypothetical protein